MDMRILGAHTYYGGFQRGLESLATFDSLGSAESWPMCLAPRAEDQKLKTLSFAEAKGAEVDLLYANPPCSRFSSLSCSEFSHTQQTDLSCFAELNEVLDLTLPRHAFWWETGPLAWRKGLEVTETVSRALAERWDEPVTEIRVRLDLRCAGVPHRRPRCHFLHVRGTWSLPETLEGATEEAPRLWDFLEGAELSMLGRWPHPATEVEQRALLQKIDDETKFMAMKPKLLEYDAPFSPAVLSGREISWPDRWFSVEEYARLMGYDEAGAAATRARWPNGYPSLALLSKSVSSTAARWVAREILEKLRPGGDPSQVWHVDAAQFVKVE